MRRGQLFRVSSPDPALARWPMPMPMAFKTDEFSGSAGRACASG
jgi:hypothetical protein